MKTPKNEVGDVYFNDLDLWVGYEEYENSIRYTNGVISSSPSNTVIPVTAETLQAFYLVKSYFNKLDILDEIVNGAGPHIGRKDHSILSIYFKNICHSIIENNEEEIKENYKIASDYFYKEKSRYLDIIQRK
jgi:restriction endonuclease S subunit